MVEGTTGSVKQVINFDIFNEKDGTGSISLLTNLPIMSRKKLPILLSSNGLTLQASKPNTEIGPLTCKFYLDLCMSYIYA